MAAVLCGLAPICGRLPPEATAYAIGVTPIRLHASAGWGRPAVSDGAVYYLSKRHDLFAIDRASWVVRWQRRLAAGSALTAGSDVVVTRHLAIAGDGGVFAFERDTGAPRWRVDEEREAGVAPGRFMGPVRHDVLWVGSAGGTLSAIHAQTGGLRWQAAVGSRRTTVFAPVVDRDLVVSSFTDFGVSPRVGGVAAMEAASGAVRWTVRFSPRSTHLAATAAGPPLVAGDMVMAAASDGVVYGVSRDSGRVRWTMPAIAPPESTPAHEDFRALALAPPLVLITSLSGVLAAFDRDSRAERWRFVSPPDGSIAFGLTVDGTTAYVPLASGRMAVVNTVDGRLRRMVGGPPVRVEWEPTVVDGHVYFVAEDGLYAFLVE